MKAIKELRDEVQIRMYGKTKPTRPSESIARISFRAGWDAAAKELGCGGYGTPTAADPWDEFRREAALEMLRQRGGFCGDIASRIIEDVNRLTEGLIQGNNVNSMNSDE